MTNDGKLADKIIDEIDGIVSREVGEVKGLEKDLRARVMRMSRAISGMSVRYAIMRMREFDQPKVRTKV